MLAGRLKRNSKPPVSTAASTDWARIVSSVSGGGTIAKFHAGPISKGLTRVDCRKVQRQCSGCQHTALDDLQKFREIPVTIVGAEPSLDDPGDRPRKHVSRMPYQLDEGGPQILHQLPGDATGRPPCKAVSVSGHLGFLVTVPRRHVTAGAVHIRNGTQFKFRAPEAGTSRRRACQSIGPGLVFLSRVVATTILCKAPMAMTAWGRS